MSSTRIRSLKPEFHTSPSTAQVSHKARLLYQALWNLANDYGYGETNLLVILGTAFPTSDGVTVTEIESLLREIAAGYGTVFYEVRGRHYYWIPTWPKHNRKPNQRSRQWYPTPDDPDTAPDLRFHRPDHPILQSSGNFRELPGGSCGTGERGNRGTGERGSSGTGEQGSSGAAANLPELSANPAPRSPNTNAAAAATDLVESIIDNSHPAKVRNALIREVTTLLDDSQPTGDIAAGLQLWLTKPNLGPKALPLVVSEAIKTRSPALSPNEQKKSEYLVIGDALAHRDDAPPDLES